MGYTKVISYQNNVEIYEYEKNIRVYGRERRRISLSDSCSNFSFDGEDIVRQEKQRQVRKTENVRRAILVFQRLVASNLGEFDVPILITLTYAENMQSLDEGRKDFESFVRAVKNRYGKQIRFICVPEFQERGAVHFHSLWWGLSSVLVGQERYTREFANLWGKGFTDLILTDGDKKLVGYLGKYFGQVWLDPRLKNRRAYTCSQNCLRPFYDKNALIEPYYYGFRGIDLSTYSVCVDKKFETQYMGMGRFRKFIKE